MSYIFENENSNKDQPEIKNNSKIHCLDEFDFKKIKRNRKC